MIQRALIVCCLISCAAGVLRAQGTGEEAEHDALRKLKGLYEEAIAKDNLALLEPHLDPGFSGVMVTDQAVGSFKDLKEYWDELKKLMGTGGKYTVELVPERSLLLGDVALARGIAKDHVVTGAGMVYDFQTSWTAVARKAAGSWKLLRIHGSLDPLRNPFVVAQVKAAGVMASLAGILGGVIAGCALGFLLGRRRKAH